MPDHFLRELRDELDRLEACALRRRLVPRDGVGRQVTVAGRPLLNLASNDYLGLSQHPHLKQAAADAIARYGTGATASRLVTGHLDAHASLEARFAAFKHAEAALLLPTGYMANLAVLTALAGPGDLVCLDKLCHASLIDAARASGATVRTFPHLQVSKLERLLDRQTPGGDEPAETRNPKSEIRNPRTFIVTDSVFSMDGDVADLPALCDLADRYDAVLVVDEAHGTGVLGAQGSGLCELQGVAHRVPIVVSTASKGLGGLGGIVTAPQAVVDTLVNKARPLIYTTGVPAAQAAVVDAALDVVRDEPWRRERLGELSQRFRDALRERGWPLPIADAVGTPIVPLVTGTTEAALALADRLGQAGFLAVAIRPPTVAPNTARVRVSLRADLEDAELTALIAAVGAPAGVATPPTI